MITVRGIEVQIIRKAIKNLHLAVYPPDGHVRVAAPEHVNDENVRLAVIDRLAWIKRQQQDFRDQPRQSERQYISGECHYFLGRRCRLDVIERAGKAEIQLLKSGRLKMFVRPDANVEAKERLLNDWYRQALKKRVAELLDAWQPLVGKEVRAWGIKKMKTKWGSCNIVQRRIWLNLELAKKPPECLEYILVHELVHLHERHHNDRFRERLEAVMPDWRARVNVLNSSPLAHEDWRY